MIKSNRIGDGQSLIMSPTTDNIHVHALHTPQPAPVNSMNAGKEVAEGRGRVNGLYLRDSFRLQTGKINLSGFS